MAMNFSRLSLLGFFSLVLSSSVLAGGPNPRELRERAEGAFQRLAYAGIETIGGVSLLQLVAELREKVSFRVDPDFRPVEATRDCAAYDSDRKEIVVSEACSKTLDGRLFDSLLIHESLGALGYDDHEYEWSAQAAYILGRLPPALDPARIYVPDAVKALIGQMQVSASLAREGSGTGVRGGGDLYALYVKTILFDLVDRLYEHRVLSALSPPGPRYLKAWEKIRDTPVSTSETEASFRYDGAVLIVSRSVVEAVGAMRTKGPETPPYHLMKFANDLEAALLSSEE